MLTKEECNECLQFLKEHAMELVDDEDMEGNIVYDYYNFSEEDLREYVEPIEKLIAEHFDNPPLKFEELKEGMWIWDNKDKAYMKIESVSDKDWVWLYIDSSEREHIDELYEPNRFYRKEVQDV